jgi:hypothetical protein
MPMRCSRALIGVFLFFWAAEAAFAATVTKVPGQDLSFGDIAGSTFGGTVTLGVNGSRTPYGVLAISTMPGQLASFNIDTDRNCRLSLPANGDVSLTGPGQATMSVTGFNSTLSDTFNTPQTSVHVGATLNVGGNQAPGTYIGSFTVTLTCD